MSYILDALNKSENERRAVSTMGLAAGASFMVAPHRQVRHQAVAFLVATGMLATGIALGHWQPWRAGKTAEIVEALPLPVAARVVATASVATASVAEPAPVASAPTRAGGVAPAKAAGPLVQVKPRPVVTTVVATGSRPALVASAPVAVRNAPAGVDQTSAVPVAPPSELRPVAATPLPLARILAYGDLPASVQSTLPKIVFGGFAGGGEADGRVAFINNRLIREGEEVSPGLRLETVDQDGVVLGYQGYRFRQAQY